MLPNNYTIRIIRGYDLNEAEENANKFIRQCNQEGRQIYNFDLKMMEGKGEVVYTFVFQIGRSIDEVMEERKRLVAAGY